MDTTLFLGLPKKAHSLLEPYAAPGWEESYFKYVPIELLAEVQKLLKPYGSWRYMFRGPRSGDSRGYTRKENAFAFSVYKRY